MRGRIHRGAQEIGGTCLELEACGKRIVLDIGLPLDQEASEAFVPSVSGFRELDKNLLAVAISHPHQDHYGLAQYLQPEIPILIGEAAHRILKTARHFAPAGATFRRVKYLKDRQTIPVGPFKLTPYLVDHSAYDSYALLVEAEGRRLFYTGDFRGHGRKASLFEHLLRQPPKGVHTLLMEGTTVGRDAAKGFNTEQALEKHFIEQFESADGLCLVWTSGQNIDRLVTIFKACRKARRQLILDLYTAEILRATGNAHLPQGIWEGMRVYVPEAQRRQIKRKAIFETIDRYGKRRILPKQLAGVSRDSVMLFRPSMAAELKRAGCLEDACLVYSLWEGYLKQERLRTFHNWMRKHQISMTIIHTSGHASVADLQRLANAIRPKRLIPIHSAHSSGFRGRFENVVLQQDGEWWEV